ncbi:MAG: NUDIX domain-containing protein [bacterium]|nr:NUDIX domain-containing protein [bacterium]
MGNNNGTPDVGTAVIIERNDGKILVGKRIGSFAPYYSIPGGKMEIGETFEQSAIREIKEETDLDIHHPKVISLTNNLETYRSEGIHHVSIYLLVKDFSGRLKIMEPEKCAEWLWVDPRKLPDPHFEASRIGVAHYLCNVFYQPNND